MGIVCSNVHLDVKATGYLARHVGWAEPALSVIVAISRPESDGNSGTYRPESQNPAGGRDIGLVEINDKAWPKPDPFTRFHPITNLRDALTIWNVARFVPWGYPTVRTDASLGVAAIRTELGANPYSIDRSPYWQMMAAGVDVMDLPVPPANVYVSRLPTAPLRYGQSFMAGQINALQRWLAEDHLFAGTFDSYYGGRTRDGVALVQQLLARLGLWTGPTDGKEWSVALKRVIDELQEWDFLTLWG